MEKQKQSSMFIKNEVKEALDKISKKVVKISTLEDKDAKNMKKALMGSLRTLKAEYTEVLEVIKNELVIINGDLRRREEESLHMSGASLFNISNALPNKTEEKKK